MVILCRRISPGRLRFIVKPPIDMAGLPAERHAALLEVAARVNAAYENCIRRIQPSGYGGINAGKRGRRASQAYTEASRAHASNIEVSPPAGAG